MRFVLTAAALGLLCTAPAMAQSTPSTSPSSSNSATSSTMAPNSSSTQNGTNGTAAATAPMAPGALQKDVRNDLEKAGYTDIQVMPSSFLVRAKDKQGRPVMMLINPDSVTEITNVAHAPGKAGSTAKN